MNVGCINEIKGKNWILGCLKYIIMFLAGLQSNSGLWIDDVRLSVRPSVRLSTFWLTFVFKFVLGHINQYRLDTLHGNRPW